MKHILTLLLMLTAWAAPMTAQTSDFDDGPASSLKHYYITLGDGSAVPDVNFVMQKTQGNKPVMLIVSKNDNSEVARVYFFSNYRASKSSCIGYDERAKAFVIELKQSDDFRSGHDLLDLCTAFIRPYTTGTIYADVPLQYICSAAASGEPRAVAIMNKAAEKSKGQMKKKLPSLKLTGYDIRRDYWELEAHGDFNPFDFQIVNLKNDYIAKQAKRFGYTQSVDRESILRRLQAGDSETADFVSGLLTISKKKK